MDWIPIIAGAVISLLVLFWLLKVLKTTLWTALLIAAILFGLNFLGYGPGQLVDLLIGTLQKATGG